MNMLLILLNIIIVLYVCLNLKKMHKFTKVAYFLLMFTLLAVTVGAVKFAVGLFTLCMFMVIIRVVTNRKEIYSELGGKVETPAKDINIPDLNITNNTTEEDVTNILQGNEAITDEAKEDKT